MYNISYKGIYNKISNNFSLLEEYINLVDELEYSSYKRFVNVVYAEKVSSKYWLVKVLKADYAPACLVPNIEGIASYEVGYSNDYSILADGSVKLKNGDSYFKIVSSLTNKDAFKDSLSDFYYIDVLGRGTISDVVGGLEYLYKGGLNSEYRDGKSRGG